MPATTTISSNKKSEVELVSERVTKTKKEIEQLKAQLQKLIDDGIHKSDLTETKQDVASLNNDSKTDITHNEPARNYNEKITEIVSEVQEDEAKTGTTSILSDLHALQQPKIQSRATVRRKDKSPTIQVRREESPKKIRHYNQEAAREYIKKQKEKRRESLKNKKKEVDLTQDIKKQRLRELRQKSLQIVSKNIQHNRERSRSRSRDALDQQEFKHPHVNGGPVAQIQNKLCAQNSSRSVDKSDVVPNSYESKLEPSLKFAHPQLKNVTVRSNLRDLSAMPKLDIPKHIQFDVDNLPIEAAVNPPSIDGSCSIPSLHHNTEDQQTFVKSSEFPIISFTTHHINDNIPPMQFMSPNLIKKHNAAITIQTAFRGFLQKKLYRIGLNRKRQIKERATKEVQTVKIVSDIPVWLQAPPTLPYPYNFINTVKRKLNLALQETTMLTDGAVQNSVNEQKGKNENSVKPKNSDNKNTDLKSFLSHKCLDLDIQAIKPLALTRNSSVHDKICSVHNTVSHPILKSTVNGRTSDSDTSKNIPELSSEGSEAIMKKHHCSKRARSSDTDHDERPKINTEKIKKLKLLHPKRLNFNLENINSHESSKFSDEISEHITVADSDDRKKSKSLSNPSSAVKNNFSGRDSIIASNKCNYSQNNKEQRPAQGSIFELNRSKVSVHSMKTTEPIIPPQDTLSSFGKYMGKNNVEKPVESNDSTIKTDMSTENLAEEKSEISKHTETLNNKSQSKHSENRIKSNSSIENFEEYSSNFTKVPSTAESSIPLLKRPNISLKSSQKISKVKNSNIEDDEKVRIILRPGEKATGESRGKSNNIHVKFEAELHLLNEFNDSLRQIMAMDKSLLELRNTNSKIQNDKSTTTYHTQDTQTSFVTKSSTDTKIATESLQETAENHTHLQNEKQIQIPTINYSRGSEISEEIDILTLNNTLMETNDTSLITTGLELSELKDNMLTSSNEENNVDISVAIAKENHYNKKFCTGLSLEMFEQLIKDEDARIENLKTILKIREKALVDRTKGELAWLEIQKKHLRDSGQLQQISAIKKKQRGLLIKLEHERHEMQRLKQMQKAASKERKSVLREQRNMIKAQLSSASTMITKIKRNAKEEKRQSGPLKVYNIKSHSESIRSETSMSRRSSAAEEIISVVSHSHSVVSHITEEAIIPNEKVQEITQEMAPISIINPQVKAEHVKRSLLMREAALQKRRKAAEELLQWHQRLIEEEEKIAELEQAASAIINQIPTVTNSMISDEPSTEKHKFKGTQLNLLWCNMTGREEQKFNDNMTYTMSKISLERFCKDAKKYAINRNKSFSSKKSGKLSDSDSSLSAMDITVTELTNSKLKKNSEKCKKFKPKSPHSVSEIASQIVITKSTSKDSQEYTSDFESLISVNNEPEHNTVSTDDQKIIDETTTLHSIKNENSNSKIISVREISQSDNRTETIAEQSKTITPQLGINGTNENDTIAENILQQSTVEIIDDTSTSANTSIPETITNILSVSSDMNEVSEKVDKSEKPIEELKIMQSASNHDSTSKDISTDIEHDNESEILETTNNNTTEIDEITSSLSQQTEIRSKIIDLINNDVVLSEDVSSDTSNKEILEKLISRSSYIEENIISENDNKQNNPSENQILSETYEDQTIEGSDHLFNQGEDHFVSKQNETQSAELIDEDLSKSKEDESNESILTNNSPSSQDTNQFIIKTSDNHATQTSDKEISSELDDQLLNKTDENDHETNQDQSNKSIVTTTTVDSLSNQDDDQLPNKTDETLSKTTHSSKSIPTNNALSSQDEDQLLNKTDKNLSETSENQSSKPILTDDALSSQDKDQFPNKTDENVSKTSEDQSSKPIPTDYALSSQDEDDKIDPSIKSTLTDDSSLSEGKDLLLNKSTETQIEIDENLSKTNEDQSNATDKSEILSELDESGQLFDKNCQSSADQLLNNKNENQQSEGNVNQVITPQNENHIYNKNSENKLLSKSSKGHNNINKIKANSDCLFNNLHEHPVEDLKDVREELCQSSRSEPSLNKSVISSTNKKNENRILLENKPNEPEIDASEIKTLESDDDTEIISDLEWNQLSDGSEIQELKTPHEKSCIDNMPERIKINLEEKEDSTKTTTTTSTSKKDESPLLLSYGFVEKKESEDQTDFETSTLHDDNIQDIQEDSSQQDSLQDSVNTEVSFTQTSYQKIETPKDDVNQSAQEDSISHKSDVLEENYINHSSDNRFEQKSEIDLNQTYEVDVNEETKHKVDVKNENEETDISPDDQKKITTDLEYIDVKKRVSEILADANIPSPRGDKSPRVQDLYVTAYDVVSPEHSSSSGSPTEDIDQTFTPPHPMYGSDEVEELLKKQLEIEQEIKEIQQQQQKEHIPYLYVREIPNKPPPPYTPPVIIQTPVSGSILPATEKQIGMIAKKAADILHKAYLNRNLQNVTLSTDDGEIMQNKNNIDKNCFEFVFDLSKEAAIEHYKQFETESGPSWMHLTKRSKLAIEKPPDKNSLQKVITTKVKQWLGYEVVKSTENIKRKWSGKKRDHVDELLVVECQAEETEWTNYDRDELIVKDELTKDIMNMLLNETAQVFNNILNKKTFLT